MRIQESLVYKGLNEVIQGSQRLEKFLNLKGFLEKSLIFHKLLVLENCRKTLEVLEKSLNFT